MDAGRSGVFPPGIVAFPVVILVGFRLLRDGQVHYDRWRRNRDG